MWYPLQWYVRNHTSDGRVEFNCFEATAEEETDCIILEGSQLDDGGFSFGNPAGLLVKESHAGEDGVVRESYRRDGTFNNLLWFPESYRRPDENREEEPMYRQLARDFRFFGDIIASRESWVDVMDYVLFRDLDKGWYSSEFYSYLP